MGLFDNAHRISDEKAIKDYGHILGEGETVGAAYKLVRDMIILTDRRLVFVDVQGVTGKKIEIRSIPYRHITQFTVETAGHFELDADLKIQVMGQDGEIVKHFNKNVNIYEVQAILAEAIVNYGG